MKVKVISSYRDKFTKKIHQPGEELNISKERADEILKVGNYIELLEEPKQQGKSSDDEEPKQQGKSSDDEEPKKQDKTADDEEPKKPADGKEPKTKGKKKNNKSNEENAG